MTEKLKKADRYVTFIPFDEETHLFIDREGPNITSLDSKILAYGGEEKIFEGQTYYQYTGDSLEKLELLTNAYDLHYEAVYKGERFGAGVSHLPSVTLFWCGSDHIARDRGFKQVNKGEWEKKVDVSQVEIVTIKEPVDLSKYLIENIRKRKEEIK